MAIHRRLHEELGLRCPLQFLFRFRYQAQFDAAGAEQELCSVYVGRCNGPVRINRDEILAWRWISPEALQAELAETGGGTSLPRGSSWSGSGSGAIIARNCAR